ncbi:short-chain dehydrogenase [Oerskovia sp. M15]
MGLAAHAALEGIMRTVVVTGSASGIGKALKGLLEADGHRVVGVDLRDADVAVDLTTDAGRAELVEKVTALSGGTIDAVVANAGLSNGSPRRSRSTTSVRSRPSTACARSSPGRTHPRRGHVLYGEPPARRRPARRADPRGRRGRCPGPRRRAHRGRDGRHHLWQQQGRGRALAAPRRADRRLGRGGHPAQRDRPGIVQTGMTREMLSTDESTKAVEAVVPMPLGGIMGPEVPAYLLRFLVSPENSHMCGQVVFVDGGSDVVFRSDKVW